jgi:splicing factor 1
LNTFSFVFPGKLNRISHYVTNKSIKNCIMEPTVEENTATIRKRRNRWDDVPETEETKVEGTVNGGDSKPVVDEGKAEDTKRARKSRWGSTEKAVVIPTVQQTLSTQSSGTLTNDEIVQQTLILKLELQQINQKLITVVYDAMKIEQDPNRSPSPPPKYDSSGKRTNTREFRMRETLNARRAEIIDQLTRLNPAFQPPIDFIKSKPVRRIFIPKSADPNINFIGLIIGPRGITQKELEQETGCKISIRGKGSAKEGSKGRASKHADEDEELHVHIQADDEEKVERAAKKIEILLRPIDDALNEHKQKQLKQLALINGTLRESEYCPVCGEKGHQQFDCPHRAKAFKAAGVKCSICGDLSHPTRDCPLKSEGPTNETVIDDEYDNFLAELTGGPARKKVTDANGDEVKPTSAEVLDAYNKSLKVGGTGGQTVLAPIVDVLSKKPQTVIHVSNVLTGAAPPTLLSGAPSSIAGINPLDSSAPGLSSLPTVVEQPVPTTMPMYPAPPVAPGAMAYPGYMPYPVQYPVDYAAMYYGYDMSMYQQAYMNAAPQPAMNTWAPPPPPPPPPSDAPPPPPPPI